MRLKRLIASEAINFKQTKGTTQWIKIPPKTINNYNKNIYV